MYFISPQLTKNESLYTSDSSTIKEKDKLIRSQIFACSDLIN